MVNMHFENCCYLSFDNKYKFACFSFQLRLCLNCLCFNTSTKSFVITICDSSMAWDLDITIWLLDIFWFKYHWNMCCVIMRNFVKWLCVSLQLTLSSNANIFAIWSTSTKQPWEHTQHLHEMCIKWKWCIFQYFVDHLNRSRLQCICRNWWWTCERVDTCIWSYSLNSYIW